MCHGIVGSANFEGKDWLSVFSFQKDGVVEELHKTQTEEMNEFIISTI